MSQEFRAGRGLNRIPPARRSPAPVDESGALRFDDPAPQADTTTTEPPKEKPPVRFVIRCELGGFPVEIEVVGKVDALIGTVKRLKQLGAVPPGEPAPDWPDEPFGE